MLIDTFLNALGRPIGSTSIDMRMHQLLVQRLEKMRTYLVKPPGDLALEMIMGEFGRFKCLFGTDMSMPALFLDIPGFPPGFDFDDAGVLNSQMIIRRQEAPSVKSSLNEVVNKN